MSIEMKSVAIDCTDGVAMCAVFFPIARKENKSHDDIEELYRQASVLFKSRFGIWPNAVSSSGVSSSAVDYRNRHFQAIAADSYQLSAAKQGFNLDEFIYSI